jgi:hypothetical protein
MYVTLMHSSADVCYTVRTYLCDEVLVVRHTDDCTLKLSQRINKCIDCLHVQVIRLF